MNANFTRSFAASFLGLLLFFSPYTPGEDIEELLRKGLACYEKGDLACAREHWQQGLALALKNEDNLFAGSFHGNLGIVYSALSEYSKAVDHLEASLRIARSSGDRQGEKNRLNNLGGLYLLLGKPAEALKLYREALTIARDLGDRKLEATSLANIGQALLARGENKEALPPLRQALEMASELKDPGLEADILSHLGLVYGAMGNYGQGLSHFRRAIEVGDQPRQVRDYNRMGVLAREAGDPRAAATQHRRALELAERLGKQDVLKESRQLLERASSQMDGTEPTLLRRKREGLERMLERLRAHGLDELARQVEQQLEQLARPATPPLP